MQKLTFLLLKCERISSHSKARNSSKSVREKRAHLEYEKAGGKCNTSRHIIACPQNAPANNCAKRLITFRKAWSSFYKLVCVGRFFPHKRKIFTLLFRIIYAIREKRDFIKHRDAQLWPSYANFLPCFLARHPFSALKHDIMVRRGSETEKMIRQRTI